MESWRKVWREGFAPQLSVLQLSDLARALREDSPRLVQGITCRTVERDGGTAEDAPGYPVAQACAVGYCAMAAGAASMAQVTDAFGDLCAEADRRLGEPAGCRWFLNAFDEWPRAEMLKNLLPEVERELAIRRGECLAEEPAA